jgi:hypothetical protein
MMQMPFSNSVTKNREEETVETKIKSKQKETVQHKATSSHTPGQ